MPSFARLLASLATVTVVATFALLDTARAYVEALADNVAPATLAETKRLVYRHIGCDYRTALEEADVAQERFVAGDDAKEGARALIEKRPARFRRVP